MINEPLIEAGVAILTVIAGGNFWQFYKRGKFLLRAAHDPSFLSQLIITSVLDNPPPRVSPFTHRLPPGYFLNVRMVIQADRNTQRIGKLFFAVLTGVAFIGSYLLGLPYLLFTALVFFLSAIPNLSRTACANAADQIVALAIILDRWNSENGPECEAWITNAWALRPIYDAVKAARSTA